MVKGELYPLLDSNHQWIQIQNGIRQGLCYSTNEDLTVSPLFNARPEDQYVAVMTKHQGCHELGGIPM